MRQIRRGTFETNSSSTHSLTMCSGSDYDAWERGETYFVKYQMTSISAYADKEFVTFEEALDIIAKAKDKGVNLVLGVDCVAGDDFSNECNTQVVPSNNIPEGNLHPISK